MTAHSRIGASSMKRWQVCPGSVKLSEGLDSSSKFAQEGTAAHALAEQCLVEEHRLMEAEPVGEWAGCTFPYDDHGETKTIVVSQEMADAVQVYVDFIREEYKPEDGDELLIEHRFHLKHLHEDLFGTSDAVIWKPKQKMLVVIDYKHGAGVAVEALDNPQLRYYAVGALLESKYPAEVVETVIVQPRCEHPDGYIRGVLIPVVDLADWVADLLDAVARVETANHDPVGYLAPGPHCKETFCSAQAICPALMAKVQEVARQEFDPILSYDPEKLAETLRWLPVLEGWLKAVREFAYGEAEHGRTPPGFKLVEKRATRKWRDEDSVIRWLTTEQKLLPEEVYDQKLKSVATIEKIFGKGGIPAEYVSKESSGCTLVPEEDRREPVKSSAQADFA